MTKIVRTPTRAEGGITPKEKAAMDRHTQMWIKRAFRTDPIEPDKIVPAIYGLYDAAGLERPRVVIAPSPLVMAFAYGAAAAIWHQRQSEDATLSATTTAATRAATDAATTAATYAATYAATTAATIAATTAATHAATYAATTAATDAATSAATNAATRAATDAATYAATAEATDAATTAATTAAVAACSEIAGGFGLKCAARWSVLYQGGNMWSEYDSYLTAFRDIIGLRLPEYEKYSAWEQAAIHGGFRVMHEKFCIVSDFPEIIRIDDQNRPHCENGPSHRWRDGWSLYHWHGVRVPAHWIEDSDNLDPAEVIAAENVEQRAAGAAIVGWAKMSEKLDRNIIDGDPDTDIGALVELTLPGLDEPGRFLMAQCPRNGTICEGVPRRSDIDGKPIETAIAAQAWRDCLPAAEYIHPTIRT